MGALVLVVFALCNLFTLNIALQKYANSADLLLGWIHSFALSLAIGWLILDPTVIIVRNNVNFTKKILKTWKYQVIEKWVIVPLGIIGGYAVSGVKRILASLD